MSHAPPPPRIYLDNGATSWPKPEEVYAAVERYQRELGAPAGRSSYSEAAIVSQAVADVRLQLARLLGVDDASRVIFTANGSDSLNLAIHGLLHDGDHVITSVIEHNSVLRPLAQWEDAGRISVTRVACDGQGYLDPDDVRAALRPESRLVAISHASNVTGALQPIADISQIAHAGGAYVLCDAAQSVGHVPVDMKTLEVDLLATSGHKGLLGPLGTGVLALAEGIADSLQSVRQGGTGTNSELARQPEDPPSKYEAGNLNVPGLLGLGAGVTFLRGRGLETIESHGARLVDRLLAGFGDISGLRVLGPAATQQRVPLVSIIVDGYDPQELALGLDAVYRVQVRAGLHCAPLMHKALGTDRTGGTVRFSLGVFNTEQHVDAAVRAVAEIAASEVSI
jgi:cysteine desulfurase/selenocysteine lyase